MARRSLLEIPLRLCFVLLIAILFFRFGPLFSEVIEKFQRFKACNFSYERLREHPDWGNVYLAWKEAKQIIPPDAHAWMTFDAKEWVRDVVRGRYVLYPGGRDKGGEFSFLVDTGKRVEEPADSSWKSYELSNGVMVYAVKPEADFLDSPRPPPTYSATRVGITFVVLTLVYWVIGLAFLNLLRVRPSDGGSLWHAGASYLLGYFATAALVWILMLLGGPLNPATVLCCIAVTLAVAVFFARKGLAARLRELGSRENLAQNLPRGGVGVLVLVLALVIVGVIFVITITTPINTNDPFSTWIFKSRVFFHQQHLVFDRTHNNEYPVFWPLSIAMQYTLIGGTHDEVVKWTVALLVLAMMTQIMGAFSYLKVERNWAWIFITLYFAFFYHPHFTHAYAEVIFMSYLTAMLTSALACLRVPSRSGFLALGFLMALGLASTRPEGFVPSAIVGIAYAMVQQKPWFSKRAWLALVLFTAPVLIMVCWRQYGLRHGWPGMGINTQGLTSFSLHKLWVMIRSMYYDVQRLGQGQELFGGAALIALLQFRRKWTREEVFLGLVSAASLLFIGGALFGMTVEWIAEYSRTITIRQVIHASPPLLMLMASHLARAADSGRDHCKPSDQQEPFGHGKQAPVRS